MTKQAILLLDGEDPFYGSAAGWEGTAQGALALSALASGFSDLLTDPVYSGKLVCFTYPHVGNAGVVHADMQSAAPAAAGVIAREFSRFKANRLGDDTMDGWMEKNRIPAIEDIDTRSLAEIVVRRGRVRAVLGTGSHADEQKLRAMLAAAPISSSISVGTSQEYEWKCDEPKAARMRVVVFDFGVKRGFLRRLAGMGCAVTVVPAATKAEAVLDRKPDGVVFSAGPGAPADRSAAVPVAASLFGKIPLWGVGIGAGIIAQAAGAKVDGSAVGALGHQTVARPGRPVAEVTMQCHEFALDSQSLTQAGLDVTHVNINDGSVAGFACKKNLVMGTLYHPEGEPGPHDSLYLFDRFHALMLKKEASNA